jgi:hypothetical protein
MFINDKIIGQSLSLSHFYSATDLEGIAYPVPVGYPDGNM